LDTFFKNKTPQSSAFQQQQQSVSATHVATLINQQSSNNNQNEKTATNDCCIPPSDKADFLDQMRSKDNLIRDFCFTLNLTEQDATSALQGGRK